MIPINRNPDGKTLRAFSFAMLVGFGLLGGILWFLTPDPNSFAWHGIRGQKIAIGLWIGGMILCLAGVGPRGLSVPVYVAWMTVGMFVGTIMTFVTLSVMFIVLLPVFSLIRLSDPLRMKLKPPGESYWEEYKKHEPTLERTARPF